MMKLRVLVAEDSLTVRKRLCEALSEASDITLVGEAENGQEAIELCKTLRPDVISMDMMMPVMSGLAATEYIMAYYPTPILIVSSSFNRGELFKTYEALAAGAVDLMEKPKVDDFVEDWVEKYISMLKLVSRVKVVTHLRGRKHHALEHDSPQIGDSLATLAASAPLATKPMARLIAIGASTGGPGAIVEVLRALPAPFPLPIVLVIHISEPFSTTFAEWLNDQTPHDVQIAKEGQSLNKPGVFMAPSNQHMVVIKRRVHLNMDQERHSCRPSVDVLFESVAKDYGANAVGCLLTGMGQDGARGLLAMSIAGCMTVAQDEATCVVYGMPREAAILGAAQHILPLENIGPLLASTATTATTAATELS